MNPEDDHIIEECTPQCFEGEEALTIYPKKIPCVMCKKEFEKGQLDFLERCDACFHLFMTMPEDQRPKLGVPFVPIYNGDK